MNNKRKKTPADRKRRSASDPSATKDGQPVNVPATYFPVVAAVLVFAVGAWSYWPNLVEFVNVWETEPDYSHGYLVLPISLLFLWLKRETFPSDSVSPALVAGFCLVIAALGARYLAGRYFFTPIENWTILFWIAGAVLTLFGARVLWWSSPAIAFLWFAIPLPYRAEIALRLPLQRVATELSTAILVTLGEPAIAEGNVIRIGDQVFGVEEACSGIRIFFGIAAFAFALIIVSNKTWFTRLLLLISVLPVAIVANVTRIVITCLLYQHVGSDFAKKFSHDIAGFLMVPFAGVLLCCILWLVGKMFREVDVVDSGAFFRSPRRSSIASADE